MKKSPPPSRLHQQEPPSPTGPPVPLFHQQEPSQLLPQPPPRPPPLLHTQEPSYQSLPRPPPPLHQQEPWQAPRLRGPVITYIPGKPPSSTPLYTSAPNYTSQAFDESPAMETCAELEKTKPRLGFAGDVETTYQHYHQQHRINQRPTNLSPRSSSLWTELTSTFSPQDLEFLASLILSPSTYGNHQRQHQSPTSSIPHCDGDPLKRPRFNLGNAKVSSFFFLPTARFVDCTMLYTLRSYFASGHCCVESQVDIEHLSTCYKS
ncbi:pollen-specific leucine-rich repeat extensin-like protein 1 [Raphanus sativus]|uniref:Pollen-specific leucine-rich repeat extensin-like protein 1 n=1 Tax=Raphanus sativus TaxID=3726 RepID=A0A6J0LR22_RAPSA|nr:pollen-specific leucine-rich repeat extensin-like protein 1 [Raphanus sativus]